MARTNTLANFLTDVANAIRTKKGTQETISASTFDTEILNLPSGTYQTKNITVSANGSQTITPDQGYDAIDEITITTQVPQKQLQSKTYNFTTNQTIELTPDTGYDGFDIVTLNINVDPNAVNYQIYTAAYIGQNNTVQRNDGRYPTYKQIEIDLLPYINRTIIITNTGDRNFYGFTSVKPENEVALNSERQSTSGGLTYKYTGGNDRYLVYDFTTSNQSDSVIRVELASVELIEKNITANGVYDAEDDNADGFSKVTVNVPSSQINNQDKTITQNGTYTADSGYTGLGTVNVNVPSTSNIYKFATLAEAQVKNDYNPGDIAIVANIESVPFHPQIWIRNSNIDWCIVSVNDTVVLDEPVSVDVSESWSTKSNGKTNTYTVKLQITSTEATIQLPYGEVVSNHIIHWVSQDGLTYQFDKGSDLNYNITDPKGGIKVLSIPASGTNRASLFDLLSSHWDDFSLMSKFLAYKNSDIIQNYYQYRGVRGSSDTITTFYPYNLLSCIHAENGEIIDIFPQKNLYTFNMDWVTNISASSDMLLDIGDYIYVGVEIGYRTDTNSLFAYVGCATATTDSGYYQMINKSTLEVTQVPISGSGIPIVTSANNVTSYAYIVDLPILEDYKYLHISCTTSNGVKQLSSLVNSLPNVVFIDSSDRFVENHSFDDSYGFCQHPVVSLSLQEIRKPDLDMCITLANSILGVS